MAATNSLPGLLLHLPTSPKPFNARLTPKSLSFCAATAGAASSTSLDQLATHLATQDFRQADEETRRLLIALAGEPAVERGYVFFSEVQFIASSDLRAIDSLWLNHSDNKFGYSVQKSIWEKSNRDFTNFFVRLGWMKKLDTEVTQFGYRAFPDEFTWQLNQETPVGHLPLTNALRGTQLLKSLLSHPAFADVDADDVTKPFFGTTKLLSNKRVLKSDYSF